VPSLETTNPVNLLDTSPKIDVPDTEYKRLLGLPPDYVLDGRVAELADWARSWFAEHGTPWFFARSVDSLEITRHVLRVDEVELKSAVLCERFKQAGAQNAVVVAASAGPAAEQEAARRWVAEQPDEYFFMETYAAAVVEHLMTVAAARLCDWADRQGLVMLSHYSPGYPGWNLADQHALATLLRKNGNSQRLPIEVLSSGQLQPKKAQLALFGVAPRTGVNVRLAELIPCHSCSYSPCQYRRAPYRHTASCAGGAARIAPIAPAAETTLLIPTPLRREARYAINEKALERWAKTRLRVEPNEKGGIKAQFRYDGSTCTNAGRQLAFDYTVWLSSPGNGYRILRVTCGPAADDTGNEHTCSYLHNREKYKAGWESPPLIVGRPLDDVLGWDAPIQASGCLCNEADRNHKWRLVLETLHYWLGHG
jgi:hypothetical protein